MNTLKTGDRGPNVKLLQSLLKQIGYNPGPIDGIFGSATENAVKAYQRDNGLVVDGIVGPNTLSKIEPLLKGYDIYTIKLGDTLYQIARKYYTTVNRISTANPGLNPLNLRPGQKIVVPYGIDVVFTDIDYTYEIMERDIQGLRARYPFLEVSIPGKSVLGKNLYVIKLGNGPNQVFYNGAHHALEWITTPLLMKFIENFSSAYSRRESIRGYSTTSIWEQSSIYIMPMVNPDGVNIVLEGPSPSNPFYQQLLQWNDTGLPFSRVWQANTRGVDLNHNYPAGWEESKALEPSLGIDGPGPTRYSGPFPLSEPESKTVVDFTRSKNFRLVLAYHSQGQVIFWTFRGLEPPVSKRIGDLFSQVSGYALAEPTGITSYAGYKDWFIQEYRRPGYTIEVGKGVKPVPISQFPMIYNNNEELLLLASVI